MILTGKNIFKSYKKNGEKSLEILKDISLEIEKNKITIIVGASGAGKSTLLHVLSGLDTIDSGEIILSGKDIVNISDEKLSDFRNKHIGFIFQFHHLLPEFTAAENVAIVKMISGTSKKDALKDANELLTSVGLEDRINHKPAELSGGEQQRVAVARAIINNPDIIFADEPTGNLDSRNSEILNELFIKLKEEKGATFLIVTHNPGLVKIADRVLEMKDGKVLDK
ncbi:lipoprotein-releasing system ATP-binding protein LolD [bacterium BMS3Abin04]|nr:lipoprotein-releasing system ATP-binding protein LolD [bacterium BMS3Abin04]